MGCLAGCFDATAPGPVPEDVHGQTETPNVPGIAGLPPIPLVDVTATSGLTCEYSPGNAFTILETVGGGVALADFDMDGWLDILIPGGGTIDTEHGTTAGLPISLHRNCGGFCFTQIPQEYLLPRVPDYSHGCITPDLNNDGFPDIVVTCFGNDVVLINNGDGTFSDILLPPGASDERWTTAAAALDIDDDGDLDLFLARYVNWSVSRDECVNPVSGKRDACPPQKYLPARDVLLRNESLNFADSKCLPRSTPPGRALGVLAGDINSDGFSDLYVANDGGVNHLYTGLPGGLFEERALFAGVSGSEFGALEGSMGVDAGDVNGDGHCDLWVTNFEYEDNSLYLGDDHSLFRHGTISMGLSGPGMIYVGFGTRLIDLDVDGWLDLVVVNGHVYYDGNAAHYQQRPLAWRNDRGRKFVEWSAGDDWFGREHAARGLATGDLDNNGAPDVVIVRQNAPVSVLKNTTTPHSVPLRLIGTTSNRDAIGAVVTIYGHERTVKHWITSGAGYLSQSDNRLLLPASLINDSSTVVVQWPGGRKERFSRIGSEEITLVQGSGAP